MTDSCILIVDKIKLKNSRFIMTDYCIFLVGKIKFENPQFIMTDYCILKVPTAGIQLPGSAHTRELRQHSSSQGEYSPRRINYRGV